MDEAFWNKRWENNQIGFHQSQINGFLKDHFGLLKMQKSDTVFVPLCGKTLDMLWLAEQGVDVLGVEFSEKAIKDFFEENQLLSNKQQTEHFITYHNDVIKLLSGDFFKMDKPHFANVKAVFDRAALIALPKNSRVDYANHLTQHLPSGCYILLVTMQYPDGMISGPPFAVYTDEVERLFSENFSIELLDTQENKAMGQMLSKASGGTITEKVWLLVKQ